MHSAVKILPYYTYQDYVKWEGRWEIIDGLPYAMSPAPAPKHQKVVSRLHQAFLNAVDKSACSSCQVYDFIDFMVKDDTILQPDLLVVCDEIIKQYLDFPPLLVVEVLSPATELKDRNNKYRLYEEFGIKYFIIIDPETEEMEIYLLDKNYTYNLIKGTKNSKLIIESGSCILKVDLSRIFD